MSLPSCAVAALMSVLCPGGHACLPGARLRWVLNELIHAAVHGRSTWAEACKLQQHVSAQLCSGSVRRRIFGVTTEASWASLIISGTAATTALSFIEEMIASQQPQTTRHAAAADGVHSHDFRHSVVVK